MDIVKYRKSGEKETLALPNDLAPEVQPTLIQQIVVAEAANARSPHGHTLTRGEVRGGGKKPWRQKGTGRARASSSRSPVWVGGGITFGPRSVRNFRKDTNKKMRARAFSMALGAKFAEQAVFIAEDAALTHDKTKQMVAALTAIAPLTVPTLILFAEPKMEMIRAGRNIASLNMTSASSVSLTELLYARQIIVAESAFPILMNRAFNRDITPETKAAPAPKETK